MIAPPKFFRIPKLDIHFGTEGVLDSYSQDASVESIDSLPRKPDALTISSDIIMQANFQNQEDFRRKKIQPFAPIRTYSTNQKQKTKFCPCPIASCITTQNAEIQTNIAK